MKFDQHNRELIACFLPQGFKLDHQVAPEKALPKTDITLENDLLEHYHQDRWRMLFYFGFRDRADSLSPSMVFLHRLAAGFIACLAKTEDIEFSRETAVIQPPELEYGQLQDAMPYVLGGEFVTPDWLREIYGHLAAEFAREISAYSGPVADYLRNHNSRLNAAGRVFFHLVENKGDDYPFAFLATYSSSRPGDRKAAHVPLKNALLEFKGQNDQLLQLLSTVSRAADQSELISELVESGELFSPLKFTSQDAYTFLQEIPLYEACGILCRMPDWWRKKNQTLRLSLKVGEQEPAKLGMESLLQFQPELHLGDQRISEAEFREILAQTGGLALIKGKWVEVDREKLAATLAAYDKAKSISEGGDLTLAEAMRLQLKGAQLLGVDESQVELEVSNGAWLQSIMSKLRQPAAIAPVDPGDGFRAVLRDYQQKGLAWLDTMRRLGFGACLADDMGLGKTVQLIALLEHIRVNGGGKTLLVIPASLMGNWQREIDKFAPQLSYRMIYSKKDLPEMADLTDPVNDLCITTYGMAARLEPLRQTDWDLLILDEAQAIKNPGSQQTKAVKQIKAKARIAMTGTPIENRLSDLWSLFDFLNAGLLGTAKEFTEFGKKLKGGAADYARLRAVVNPFILRRLKTDRTVIADLPEKIEIRDYATLSKKQVVLYQGLIRDLEQQLEKAEGIGRKGLVLASIMKFKQICNHPDQFLGQTAYPDEQSGKFQLLREICATIAEKRERVLVFTQFREMTQPLADFLAGVFSQPGLVLHGGTPVKKRPELVDEFNGEEYVPYMVLSLKAGGVGLNLTAANHVIHFDRWWNPAVENQGTDRAYRIGQDKQVMVHKLITAGTIEEKIDGMIEDKNQLAGEIIAASGENWITEMDNHQLMDLFALKGAGEK